MLAAAASGVAGPGSPLDIWHHIVADFSNLGDPKALAAFGSVLMIDLVLAGDNAIVVGALAAGLPADQRKKVILIGIGAALVLRIFFALIVTWLMGIVGLIFAGGLLLLWVSWKFYREIREGAENAGSEEIQGDERSGIKSSKGFASAACARASRHPRHRFVAVGRDDGTCRELHRARDQSLSLDRLYRPRGDPRGRGEDDLRGLGRHRRDAGDHYASQLNGLSVK
jgi:hypothetical protein